MNDRYIYASLEKSLLSGMNACNDGKVEKILSITPTGGFDKGQVVVFVISNDFGKTTRAAYVLGDGSVKWDMIVS